MLEKNVGDGGSASGDARTRKILRHMHDWARHFGMPPVPVEKAPPPPPKPPEPQPQADPFAFEPAQLQQTAELIPHVDPLDGM